MARRRSMALLSSPVLCAVPLMLYLALGSLDFLTLMTFVGDREPLFVVTAVAVAEDESLRFETELFKQKVQFATYLVILLLILPRIRALLSFVLGERTLLLLLLVLLAGFLVSDYPGKVVTNVIHLSFGLLAAYLFVASVRRPSTLVRDTEFAVLLPTMLILLSSFLVWAATGPLAMEYLFEGRRYGGLSGNPNSFGAVCILAWWAALGLLSGGHVRGPIRLMVWGSLVIAVLCAILAGSSTALIVMAVLLVLMLWQRTMQSVSRRIRQATTLVLLAIGTVLVSALAAGLLGNDLATVAVEGVGKDVTLTGRTEIWEVAVAAIEHRPILGWSFDSHQSVFDDPSYTVVYTQYHNGFLDTLVAGGSVLMLVLGVHVWAFIGRVRRVAAAGTVVYPLAFSLVALGLHNLTEYSMLRPGNPVWELFVIATIAVCFLLPDRSIVPATGTGAPPRGQRRKRGVAKAW